MFRRDETTKGVRAPLSKARALYRIMVVKPTVVLFWVGMGKGSVTVVHIVARTPKF